MERLPVLNSNDFLDSGTLQRGFAVFEYIHHPWLDLSGDLRGERPGESEGDHRAACDLVEFRLGFSGGDGAIVELRFQWRLSCVPKIARQLIHIRVLQMCAPLANWITRPLPARARKATAGRSLKTLRIFQRQLRDLLKIGIEARHGVTGQPRLCRQAGIDVVD